MRRRRRRGGRVWLGCLVFFICGVTVAGADTVYLKDGRTQKGIVVEEYTDRIVLSTPEGEKTIGRHDIEMIAYDEADQNFAALAEQFRANGNLEKAIIYYKKALTFNPDSKYLKDMIALLTRSLYKRGGVQKQRNVQQMELIEKWRTPGGPDEVTDSATVQAKRLQQELGLTVSVSEDANFVIDEVRRGSPADEAGLERGDLIVGVWGKLTGYMELDEFIALLLAPAYEELRLQVERRIEVKKREQTLFAGVERLIGATLAMQLEGLVVSGIEKNGPAETAGVKEKDLIVAINRVKTRYIPIQSAQELIKDARDDTVELTVRREFVLWR